MNAARKIPCWLITGFLGAGKTSLVGNLLANAGGRRIAALANEFDAPSAGDLRSGVWASGVRCDDWVRDDATGNLFCAVAGDIRSALLALLARSEPPARLLVETSGLEWPGRLLHALSDPAISARVTVDGVIAVVDGFATSCAEFTGRANAFAGPTSLGSDADRNPIAAIFQEQLRCADLVLLNKINLITSRDRADITNTILDFVAKGVNIVETCGCKLDLRQLGELVAGANEKFRTRACEAEMVPDRTCEDFANIAVPLPIFKSAEEFMQRLVEITQAHNILRIKGFARVRDGALSFSFQGVGRRVRKENQPCDRFPQARSGLLTILAERGLDATSVRDLLGA